MKQRACHAVPLEEAIKENNMILKCPDCKKDLYKYSGDFKGGDVIEAKDFTPISKKIAKPVSGQEAKCPLCEATLFVIDRSL